MLKKFNLKSSINDFYYDIVLSELKMMNHNSSFPDMNYHSLLYLDIISYKENCTVSFLAEALNVSKSAVTMKVKELIHQGLIKKTQSQEDKRIYFLSLANPVANEYQEYQVKLHQVTETLEQKYTKEEINTFCTILNEFSNEYKNLHNL